MRFVNSRSGPSSTKAPWTRAREIHLPGIPELWVVVEASCQKDLSPGMWMLPHRRL